VILLLALALVQSTWGRVLNWGGVHPDYVLVAVLCWTLLRGWGEGLVWAVVGSVCVDLFSGAPFGVSLLPFLLATLLAGMASGRRLGGYIVLPAMLVLPLTLAFYVISAPLLHLLGQPFVLGTAFLSIVVRAALLNTAVTLIFYPILRWMEKSTRGETIRW
jgi:rod shape-determining protein MreD